MTRSRRARLLVPFALAAACIEERDRLDVPVLTLALADSIVAPGDSVRGVVTARDASGLIFLGVSARTADSVSRYGPFNFAPLDSVQRPFALRVPAVAVNGSLVIVTAVTVDDQEFTVEVTDTVVVRRAGSSFE